MPSKAVKPKVTICSTQRAMRVPRKKLAELVTFVVRAEGVRMAEADLAVVTKEQIAALNLRYLGSAEPTDVLSFDLSEATTAGLCAQVIVCGELAAERARQHGHGAWQELMLYVVHGLLHLMGYDDGTARRAAKMYARQHSLLEAFGKRRR